ncbi:MAG: penicillin-binding transpeptidase domain-containing protein, partial [Methanothrix sp.]
MSDQDLEISFDPPGLESHDTQESQPPEWRPVWFWLMLTGFILLLSGQAYRLQVSSAEANLKQAEGNSIRIQTVQAERGLSKDREGTILAQNSRQLALAINPETLPRKLSERQALYTNLKQKVQLTDPEITYIEEHRLQPDPIPLRTNLDKDSSLLYREWFGSTAGLTLVEIPIRQYNATGSLSHLLGYVGLASEGNVADGASPNTQVGQTGLESQYNLLLTGAAGKQYVETDASGNLVKPLSNPNNKAPQVGQTLKLSLDLKLQQVVETALKNELERRTKKYGPLPQLGASAVVLDPNTGGVLAMVSLPNYAPSLFANGIKSTEYQALINDPGDPLLNRAIQGAFAPGSTLKPLVASAGLQAGVITANTQMNTPLAIQIGDFRFPDWKLHGQTNTRKAIAESNNIFFYALGGGWAEKNLPGLGVERLTTYLKQFGLGAKTGIDLPGEISGLIPDPDWKNATLNEDWYIGNTYQMSIGQGYLLT